MDPKPSDGGSPSPAPESDIHNSSNKPSSDMNNSQASRHESVATAVEDNPNATHLAKMHKIETAAQSNTNHSDDHTLGGMKSLKTMTHSAKQKIYLHHRNKKHLTKQFTVGSIARHLRLPGHSHSHHSERKEDPELQLEPLESHAPTVGENLWIMLTTFPYWNMAFWSGWCYSIGSAMFVIDGAWAWVPLGWPDTEFTGQAKYGVPLWFFFGACLYQIGGVMAYLEAVNDGSFAGAAMKRLLEGHQDVEKELLDAKLHTFFGHLVPHHHNDDDDDDHRDHEHGEGDHIGHGHEGEPIDTDGGWKVLVKNQSPEQVYDETKDRIERRGGVDHGPTDQGQVREYIAWRWWPTWHALTTYHIFELGYLACAIQLFGVTLYGVTSIVILPGILDSLAWWQKLGAYWVPQVVASCCFLLASIMFTIMAQDKWYKPKIGAVSWWIGIWAQVGSVGFLLCAIFGLYSHEHSWAEYQSSLSSMWGSFFYMLSGLFQWYEAINVNVGPVLAFPNNRTPILLRRSPPT